MEILPPPEVKHISKKEKEHVKYLRQRERRLAYQKQNYLKKKSSGSTEELEGKTLLDATIPFNSETS